MIADLKPYPEYKESGLPWLGQVPGHWEVRPAFGAFLPNHERNRGMKEKTVLSLSYGRIIIKPPEKLHGLVPESFETYQIVNPGDIILRTVDLQNDHTSLRVGMVRNRGIITSAYLALRVNVGVNPDFGFQFLNVWDSSKAIYGYGSGLRQNLDFAHFKRMPVVVPPPPEQAAIVRFLDWANARLERAIRAKRKVIALLGEQKQAIIHRAVTRGLDPSVPLKPSEIPWLGDVPEHWNWIPIKRLLSRMDYGTSEASTEVGSIRILTMANIQSGEVTLPRSGGLDHVPDALLLDHHDLLFTRTNGNPDLVGKVGIFRGQVSDRVSFASYLVRLRVKRDFEAQWLHAILNSSAFWPFARSHALVNLQTNLNSTRYGQFLVPVPPRAEQTRIVSWIADESNAFNTAITRLTREITLLREYRTRLVADVVTGKLDVRDAAARLPDESTLDLAFVEDDTDLSLDLDPDLDPDPEAADDEAAE